MATDILNWYENHELPEQFQRVRNLYAAVLDRALLDLHYYQSCDNVNRWIIATAYTDARSAQSWIDDLYPNAAIRCSTVLQVLGLDKRDIDTYLDKHGIRFDYQDKPPAVRRSKNSRATD